MFIIANLYEFGPLPHYEVIQTSLKILCQEHNIKGSLLLAEEGINGTVAATRQAIDSLLSYLRDVLGFNNLSYQESHASHCPFKRLKILIKKEIVSLKVKAVDPLQQVGTYLEPDQWNHLISDPKVLLIDARNDYEVAIGSFKGALNPKTHVFSELPAYLDQSLSADRQQEIALFCTGGIRCEKATSYLKQKGYEKVYHLKGGILRYLAETPTDKSLWQGECFVFDERRSVK